MGGEMAFAENDNQAANADGILIVVAYHSS